MERMFANAGSAAEQEALSANTVCFTAGSVSERRPRSWDLLSGDRRHVMRCNI